MKNKVITTGSIAYDIIMYFNDRFANYIIPEKSGIISVSFTVSRKTVQMGGNATNMGFHFAKLGIPVMILGMVGNDFDEYERYLLEHDIPLEGIVKKKDVATMSVNVVNDIDGNQINIVYPGAFLYSHELDLTRFDVSDVFLLILGPMLGNAHLALSRQAKQLDLPYLFDPGQNISTNSKNELIEPLVGARFFAVNEYEFELFKKKTGLTDKQIFETCETTIITLGERGVLIVSGDEKIHVPTVPTDVRDPTGAGDAWRVGFVAGLLQGHDIKHAALIGSCVASTVISTNGAQDPTMSRSKINEICSKYFKFKAFPDALQDD